MPLYDIVGIFDRLADHDSLCSTQRYFKVNKFLESLESFWIMRSQRSRRRDKGLLVRSQIILYIFICILIKTIKINDFADTHYPLYKLTYSHDITICL